MGFTAFQILDVIDLVFFVPALGASAYVLYQHGARKQLGWRFLLLICLFRVIGAITSLISVHHPSKGLTITYDVTNNFGLSAVISTALALLDRVNTGMDGHGVHPKIFSVLHLPSLVGLILSILGSVNAFSSNTSSVSTGRTELKAAICLFLVVFISDVLIAARSFFKITHVQSGERRLLVAVLTALPFMTVRMVYSLLCAFANNHKWFSSWSLQWTAILVHGVMGVLMEAFIVTIFIAAGLMTASVHKQPAPMGKVNDNLGSQNV